MSPSMGAARSRRLLLLVNLWLAMYGGAALTTGTLVYWHRQLAELTLDQQTVALSLGVGGAALLLLAHAGAIATRRITLLAFALGTWTAALGIMGTAGWLVWRSTSSVQSWAAFKEYLRLHYFMAGIDEAELARRMAAVGALLLLLQVLLLLAGALALCTRPARQFGSHETGSSSRTSIGLCYESHAALAPPTCPPPPAPAVVPIYMTPASNLPHPLSFGHEYY